MRIISGYLGGRNFVSSGRSTHPMSEKMRGAIFNVLGDIEGLNFLDAFSGSGAISFEAISRGAASSLAIESDKSAQNDIEVNIKDLGVRSKVRLICTTVLNWLENNDAKFDVIVIDPPYDKVQINSVLELEGILNDDGTFVLSYPPNEKLPLFTNLEVVTEKNYGDSRLVFYKNNK